MESFDKEYFALDKAKKEDEKYAAHLVEIGQIEPWQVKALQLAIENRRRMVVALRASQSEELPGDTVAKSLEELSKSLGKDITVQPNEEYQRFLLEKQRTRGQDFINRNLDGVTLMVWKLSADMFDALYGESNEPIPPSELKKFLGKSYGAASQIMAIAENRVPLFPKQVLKRMQVAPEEQRESSQ